MKIDEARLLSELRQIKRERDRLSRQLEGTESEIARYVRELTGVDIQAMSSRRLASLFALTRILAESSTVHEAATMVLRTIAESEEWDLGILWLVDPKENVLRFAEGWHDPSIDVTPFESRSRETVFRPGQGLPGRVWVTGEPAWITDVIRDENFPRLAVAAEQGLHGAIGVPVWTKDRVIGVIEFFSHEVRQPDDGQLKMVATLCTQIGQFIERTRANEVIARQKRCNELILNSVGEGIYGMDEHGRATFINPAGAAMFGYDPADLIDKVLHDLIHHSKPDGSPYPQEDCPIHASLRKGEARVVTDEVFWRKDGTSFPIEYVTTPIRENGTIVGAVVAFRDVSERRRAQAELHKEREFLDAVLNSAEVAIVACDAHGILTFFNRTAREFHGLPEESVPPETWAQRYNLYRPDGKTLLSTEEIPLFRALQGETLRNVEIIIVSTGGKRRHVLCNGRALYDAHGNKIGAVVVQHDITERIEKERLQRERIQTLEQADRMKDQFLSVVSHELRTPLNFIMGFASILEDELAGPLNEQQHEHVAKIQSGADQLLHLVGNLLDASRIVAGKFSIYPVETDYAALVESFLCTMMPLADQKEIRLEHDLRIPSTVRADAHRITQVLGNLVGNALKFSPDGGHVVLRSYVQDGSLVTEVSDTGVGISQEDFPKLFTPFYQVDMSTTRQAGGTGLGLSIAKAIVESHGGTIGARSPGPGKGSTFWFTLPLDRQEPVQA